MKYGIREICEVVLKAKSRMRVGNKTFFKDEPVIYFDSLKTSSLEGASTTVYAQGGRGNARLLAWEGERTVTFTMEDALISADGLAILAGADVISASSTSKIKVHTTSRVKLDKSLSGEGTFTIVDQATGKTIIPYDGENTEENWIYIMKLDSEGNPTGEPFIGTHTSNGAIKIADRDEYKTLGAAFPAKGETILVDYYVEKENATQIEITPETFGGNFYLEASTLFRDTNGTDLPAEFVIPNCKIQSNFTFSMASSGDPSTFTFTMDAFPDYTRFDSTKKVLSVIQIIEDDSTETGFVREATPTKTETKETPVSAN